MTSSGTSPVDAAGSPRRQSADEQIDVLRRHGEPAHFIWHGRLYRVREVIAHWIQVAPGEMPTVLFRPEWATPPRQRSGAAAVAVDNAVLSRDKEFERELWSVRAGVGSSNGEDGVFQLCHDLPGSNWIMVGDVVSCRHPEN